MLKFLILLIVGLVVYGILVGVFYGISIPVLQISFFKSAPEAVRIVWTLIFGAPAVATAGILRLVYEILFGRSARRRR